MSARRYLCLPVLAALLAWTIGVGQEERFTPLFNGVDLTGWVKVNNAPGTFFVKDEMIVTTGLPTGFLRTAKMYENFILELEWMHIKPKGNSGVFIWADALPAVGSPFTRAIEVQVLDGLETKSYTSHGDVFAIWGAKMAPDRPHPEGWARCLPSEKRCKPAGQWNHYRIECKDGVIKLAVNGKIVSGGSKCTPRKGYIALEAEGSECHYRNLKIKELPSTIPEAEDIAQEGKGFVTLFNGLFLTGWKADDDHRDHWTVNSGANVLRYDGKGKANTLSSEEQFGDFELVCDCKLPPSGNATLWLRGSEVGAVELKGGKSNSWNRFEISLIGDKLVVKLNGTAVTANTLEKVPAKGPITLKAESAVEFTNLFIREVK